MSEHLHVERAIVIVGAVSLAVLAFWIAPATTPWGDEVQFADPGINLALDGRFSSGAWPYQRLDEFFLGNAPLYSLLIAAWVSVFGVSAIAVRSLNPILLIGVALLLWVALKRSGMMPSPAGRLISLLLIAISYGVTFDVWNARYDVLGMLAVSALLAAATISPSPQRSIALILLSVVLVTAGFHLGVLTVFVVTLIFLFYRSVFREIVVPVAAGLALGIVLVALPAVLLGSLKEWALITLGSQHSIVGQVGQAVVLGDSLLSRKIAALLHVHVVDPSLVLLLLAATLLGFLSWRRGELTGPNGRFIAFLLVCGWSIPVVIGVIGKFPVYYAWMAIFPTALALGLLFAIAPTNRISLTLVLVATIGTTIVGAGALLARTLYGAEDKSCEEHLRKSIGASIAPSDWVYADFPAYFMVKSRTTRVLTPSYGRTRLVRGIPEWNQLSRLVAAESEASRLIAEFGGEWEPIESTDTKDSESRHHCAGSAYDLLVYARGHR